MAPGYKGLEVENDAGGIAEAIGGDTESVDRLVHPDIVNLGRTDGHVLLIGDVQSAAVLHSELGNCSGGSEDPWCLMRHASCAAVQRVREHIHVSRAQPLQLGPVSWSKEEAVKVGAGISYRSILSAEIESCADVVGEVPGDGGVPAIHA